MMFVKWRFTERKVTLYGAKSDVFAFAGRKGSGRKREDMHVVADRFVRCVCQKDIKSRK